MIAAPLTAEDLSRWLRVAASTAKASSRLLDGADRTVLRRRDHDATIAADRKLHGFIASRLSRTPFAVLSEEGGEFDWSPVSRDPCWLVDPLDGSVNFSRGIPFNAVSIGLWRGRQPLLGVVYDFNRRELFGGICGRGASVNGRAIAVSGVDRLDRAVLLTGLPVAGSFSTAALRRFIDRTRRFGKVRYLGSAALSLAYVAAGRGDVYAERGVRLWDVAGGLAVALAAGARVQFAADANSPRCVVMASNPRVFSRVKRHNPDLAGGQELRAHA